MLGINGKAMMRAVVDCNLGDAISDHPPKLRPHCEAAPFLYSNGKHISHFRITLERL
jgi:hypothetical protein